MVLTVVDFKIDDLTDLPAQHVLVPIVVFRILRARYFELLRRNFVGAPRIVVAVADEAANAVSYTT